MKRYGWSTGEAALHKFIRWIAEDLSNLCEETVDDIEAQMHKALEKAREETK